MFAFERDKPCGRLVDGRRPRKAGAKGQCKRASQGAFQQIATIHG
jgi:hypothetical protein